MKRYGARQVDNRDAAQMLEYMEARVEALKRRIQELELENHALRWNQATEGRTQCIVVRAASV
jgi:hypothetical protein